LIVASEGPTRLVPTPLHEGAASDFARDQAALLGFRIGLRDRADAEIEPLRHVALGQQAHAGLDAAGGDVGFQCGDKGEIARPRKLGESGYPVGHVLLSARCRRTADIGFFC
jgi:hypothetical protein